MMPLHIVVVNFTRMGDLVQSGPLLRSLKRDRECRLTLIVYKLFRDVAERLPMVDSVIGFDVDRLVPRLDHNRGDLTAAYDQLTEFLRDARLTQIDELHNLSHTPQSATLCALMNPRRLYGMGRLPDGQLTVNGEWFNYLLSIMQDRTFNPFNLVEIYARFNPHGGPFGPLELTVTEKDHRRAEELLRAAGVDSRCPFVVLQPGASCASRMWPKERFAELAARLAQRGVRSVVVGSVAEKHLAENIATLSNGSAVSLAGQTDVGDLAAILKTALKLISNDTGTIHITAAVGTPAIGIYLGPAAAKDTAPFGDGHIIIEPDLKCAPCPYKSECQTFICHHTVSVDHVFELAVADRHEQKIVAARCRGVRVLRTKVSASGRLDLELLNAPATGPNNLHLSFFSRFWDTLLNEGGTLGDSIGGFRHDIPAEWNNAVSRLSAVFSRAVESMSRFSNDVANGASEARISNSLRKQVEWQNDLHSFINEYPGLSSFPRYLLVRLSTARTSDVAVYMADLRDTLNYFHHGLSLLTCSEDFQKAGIPADAAIA
ncbi:glycosyltransferase family 9 protein [candidate division KSB1 bacterium]|nr:MAG: glycosyltransferase family 9 protein [candidate division KSB1 bacterium]